MASRLSSTLTGIQNDKSSREGTREKDRNLHRVVGIISGINAKENGKLYITVNVSDGSGGLRPFGQGKTTISIVDSPLDILHRFGGVKVGQIVEIFYRGIGETGQGSARIIGDDINDFVDARPVPKEGFSVASSLPFEPSGMI